MVLIVSKPSTDAYREGWDRLWGKKSIDASYNRMRKRCRDLDKGKNRLDESYNRILDNALLACHPVVLCSEHGDEAYFINGIEVEEPELLTKLSH